MSVDINSSRSIIERCKKIEGKGLRTFAADGGTGDSFVLDKALGSWLYSPEGDKYLDFSGLYAVATIGHSHPKVVDAISSQAGELIHCPSAFPSRVRAEFMEALASITPGELNAIIPAITGAMANEIAVSLAKVRRPNAPIISFSGSYFGRSAGVVGLSGKIKYRNALSVEADAQFVPFPSITPTHGISTDDVMRMLEMISQSAGGVGSPAAVMLEPIQGNGGVVIPPNDFLSRVREFCDEHGALMIVDEIQSGCGRSGKMWAVEHEGVVPDVMTVGKAIGGGMAVSAVATKAEVCDWAPDSYSSTFLTNHVNLAAAKAAISVIKEEGLANRSELLGAQCLSRIRSELGDIKAICDIRGRGLWVAIEFEGDTDGTAAKRVAEIVSKLKSEGVMIASGGYFGEVVKMAPPLNIAESDLHEGVAKLVNVVKTACAT